MIITSRQLPLPLARRNEAMARVESKTERVCPGWVAQAEALLTRFLRECPGQFITEDFATWAEAQGLPVLAEKRTFGPLINRAARLGWIRKVEYRTDKWASPKALWEAA